MTSKYKNIEQHNKKKKKKKEQHTKRERRKVTNVWKIFTSQYLH